ncbi:hypothetical protein [Glycomyces buryatensis]|uniref:DUF4226 domain-containing protein n=1 Tax=Glycomyces buryatensis TaxID=2570927 RepID=A0A4S8QED0_9ACTN|nr:hypothetical protein [Glycomyces buryatensis]THV42758.1 hypothetical protein FAB82_04740 [Glycomyces buryatensis]
MPGDSLKGGDAVTFGKDLSGEESLIDQLRADPQAAHEFLDGAQAMLDGISRRIERLRNDFDIRTPGELHGAMSAMADDLDPARAEQIKARLDAVRDDPEFVRYKDRDIADLPDSIGARIDDWAAPAIREPSSFNNGDYQPMPTWKRKLGEAAISLGLLAGTPANGIGSNDTLTDVWQASGHDSAYSYHGEQPPSSGSSPGELADPAIADAAPDPPRPQPVSRPPQSPQKRDEDE